MQQPRTQLVLASVHTAKEARGRVERNGCSDLIWCGVLVFLFFLAVIRYHVLSFGCQDLPQSAQLRPLPCVPCPAGAGRCGQ